jgi:hypothetical protein
MGDLKSGIGLVVMRQVMPTAFVGLINAPSQSVKFNDNILISHALPIEGEIDSFNHHHHSC